MKKERVSPSDDAVLDDLRDALRRYEGPGHVRLHPRSKRLGRRVLVTVGATAVAACLALAGTTFLGGGSKRDIAYAATPPSLHYHLTPGMPSAHDLLLQLADKAAAQPDQTGRYDYISTRGWIFSAFVSKRRQAQIVKDGGLLRGALSPESQRTWKAADGTGQAINTPGHGYLPTVGARSGRLLFIVKGEGPSPEQQYPLMKLPKGTSAMRSLLRDVSPLGAEALTAQAIAFLESSQFVDPLSQATILRVLANESDVTNAGTVTDRAGRRGVAVSEMPPDGKVRCTLIFDPTTGALLDFEGMLLDSSVPVGELDYSPSGPDAKHPIPFHTYPIYVHTPAVTEYTVWLKTGRVNELKPNLFK